MLEEVLFFLYFPIMPTSSECSTLWFPQKYLYSFNVTYSHIIGTRSGPFSGLFIYCLDWTGCWCSLVNRPEVALRQRVYCSHFHYLAVIHLFQTLNGFTNCLFIEAVCYSVEQRHLNGFSSSALTKGQQCLDILEIEFNREAVFCFVF